MKAARYYGKEDIRVEEVPEPSVQPGQVKIRPSHVGICGTDLHEYLGGPNFCPVHAHPISHETIPITLGHEFSGTINELGPGVTGLSIGQSAAIQPTLACGACPACEVHAPNVCHSGGFVGLSGGGGGLSEAVCVDAKRVFVLPDHLGLDLGALVEPLAVAWHAASAAPAMDSESVVYIAGGGPIGLALILCLKAMGVTRVVTAEVASKRQEFAREFGAMRVVNPAKEDVLAVLKEVTGGRGVDVAFDCAGVPASIKSVCKSVKTRGAIVNVAIWECEIPFNPNWLTFKESTYTSVLGYNAEDFQAIVDRLRDGTIQPAKMITAKIRLEDLVKDGIEALVNDKDSHVKILVDMSRQ